MEEGGRLQRDRHVDGGECDEALVHQESWTFVAVDDEALMMVV